MNSNVWSAQRKGQSYTFRSYFELPYEADDILAEFDYSLERAELSLPKTTRQLDHLPELKQKIRAFLPFVSLSNETARRALGACTPQQTYLENRR